MAAFDTNILFKASHAGAPGHGAAREFLNALSLRQDVVLCELVLVEFYLLLRNPVLFEKPLSPAKARDRCQVFRQHPKWRLVESAPVMSKVWAFVGQDGFARRRIIDVRLALTLQHYGVDEFATTNEKDFRDLGFDRVWNPVE